MLDQHIARAQERGIKKLLFIILGLLLATFVNSQGFVSATSPITGLIIDEYGNPLDGAKISLWHGKVLINSSFSDKEGDFVLDAEIDLNYKLLIFYDNPLTSGVDYLPNWFNFTNYYGERLVFKMKPAASLILKGEIQFVETNRLPSSVIFMIIDPVLNKAWETDGFPLIYGTHDESYSDFIGLDPNHIVIPASEPFRLRLNCLLLVKEKESRPLLIINGTEPFILGKGEKTTLDLRPYLIEYNWNITSNLLENVDEELHWMEAVGFYMATERASNAFAEGWLSDSKSFVEEGRYIESYDACKRGYIELMQNQKHLFDMSSDAASSVYIIIFLLAFASTTIAFLLSNRDITKIIGSLTVCTFFLVLLYVSHPGSVIVSLWTYVITSVISIVVSLIITTLLPRYLKSHRTSDHVPIRNMIIPIFSIAKRNIRRRRLRFTLTLLSITILVMSFVSLTSFSENYGLIFGRVSRQAVRDGGLLIRATGQTETEPSFFTEKEISSGWIERQPEVEIASYKAENLPFSEPVAELNRFNINGVIGFDPEKELMIIDFETILMEGGAPHEGGILISEALQKKLLAELGDYLLLSGQKVKLEGIVNDDALFELLDLDGSPYLPSKLINVNPEEAVPMYIVQLCEPQEVIITHITTALSLPLIRISRIDIALNEGVDDDAFGERLALERGFWVWSNSENGIQLTHLGSYTQGKGLPLVVLWGIVVLNVVVTMLNSIFERRKEIHVLSSVGLNPAQISFIFIAEASIIGLTAGGIGYLSGLLLYKGWYLFSIELAVVQKISAFWSLASIGIAMTAVLTGTFATLKSSVVITPSLQRRWKMEGDTGWGPWEITIPVKLLPEETAAFAEYVVRELKALRDHPVNKTSSIKIMKEEEREVRIDFIYKAAKSTMGELYSRNTLIVEWPKEGDINVMLKSSSKKKWSYEAGSLIRMITMKWSTLKGE